jgi:hypothetical protein
MSPLLPYFGAGFLLLIVLAVWVRQNFSRHGTDPELLEPRRHRSSVGTTTRHGDLRERIFATEDWEFVSREASSEIRQTFRRERSLLAICWVRRTRKTISHIMHAHVIAARNSEDLRITMEIKLALVYFFSVRLCDLLVGLIWLRGPFRTRASVRKTMRWLAQVRTAFEQLMSKVDPGSCSALKTNFNRGAVQS